MFYQMWLPLAVVTKWFILIIQIGEMFKSWSYEFKISTVNSFQS